MKRVQFQICHVQSGRVTFVNEEWVGREPPTSPTAIDSCPREADYLNAAGESGWTLVSVLPRFSAQDFYHLYLQRIQE